MQEFGKGCLISTNGVLIIARAKVNLCLLVHGRREDGYHDIESIMQSVSLHDRVLIRPAATGISVVCDSPLVPQGEANIAYGAARAILSTGSPPGDRCRPGNDYPGVEIRVFKGIPVAAGLGGGSADAAAVLVGLNALWRLGLGTEELRRIGEGIGADVPFCIAGGTAIARGIGEALTPLPPFAGVPLVLAKPPVAVATARVYSEWDRIMGAGRVASEHELANGPRGPGGDPRGAPDIDAVAQAVGERDLHKLASLLWNDLGAATFAIVPEVERLKSAFLELGALGAVMSGSGPTVLGIPQDREHAVRMCRELEGRGVWAAVVETVSAGTELQPLL